MLGLLFLVTTLNLWSGVQMPHPGLSRVEPFLEYHPAEHPISDALILCVPGGAYMNVSTNAWKTEAHWSSDWFNAHGLNTAILRYRTPRPKGLPKHQLAWEDAQRAIRLVRANAAEWKIDPEKIGMIGFSAGGHLTLMCATTSETNAYEPVDEVDKLPCHLNWAMPVYPAYVLTDGRGDKNRYGGNRPEDVLVEDFAFDGHTCPMFLNHGDGDPYSAMGSIAVVHKLRTMNIPAEMHLYAKQTHCYQRFAKPGMTSFHTREMLLDWMRYMGFLGKKQEKCRAQG